MAEQWQVVSVPLSGGQVDEKAEIALEAPEMAMVRNGEFLRDGSIRKRRGAASIADFPSNKYHVASALVHRGALHMQTTRGAHNVHDTADSAGLGIDQNPGVMPSELTEQPAVRMGRVRSPCLCTMEVSIPGGSFVTCHAWEERSTGLIWFWLKDEVTGSVIKDPTPVAQGTEPKLLPAPANGWFTILWKHTDGTTVKADRINATTGALSGSVTVMSGLTLSTWRWDAQVNLTDETVHVAGDAGNPTVIEYTAALVATGRSYSYVAGARPVVALEFVGSNLWMGTVDTTNIEISIIPLSTYVGAAAVASAHGIVNAEGGVIGTSLAMTYDNGTHVWVSMSAVISTTATGEIMSAGYTKIWDGAMTGVLSGSVYADVPGHVMAAHPFMPDASHVEPFFPLLYYARNNALQRSLQAYGVVVTPDTVTVESSQGQFTQTILRALPVARWGSDQAMLEPSTDVFFDDDIFAHDIRRCHERDDGAWAFSGQVLSELRPGAFDLSAADGGDTRPLLGPADTMELGADEVRLQPLPLPLRAAQSTPHSLPIVAGGMATTNDGLQMHEASIQAAPEPPAVSAVVTAPLDPPLPERSYRWRLCWRWVDNEGRLRRSAPSESSVQVTYVAGAAGGGMPESTTQVTLRVLRAPPTAIMGVNHTFLQLEVYRQEDSIDSLFRLSRVVDVSAAAIVDDAWFEVTDNLSRAGSVDTPRQFLYTEGGELPNQAVPAALDVAQVAGRVWVLSGEDPTMLWPSKLLTQEGSQLRGPEWSLALVVRAPEPIRAISALDDRLVAFGERGIYVIDGEGLDNNGQGTPFSVRGISAGFGVRDPRGVAECMAGVVFRSTRGVYLLGRDLALNYIGAGVEVALGDSQVISTLVVPSRAEVRLNLSATGTGLAHSSSGTAAALVWDYLGNRWSTWSHGGGACVVRNGEVEKVELDGETGVPSVYREQDGLFTEAPASWIIFSDPPRGDYYPGYLFAARTPHIRPSGRDSGHMSVRLAQFASDLAFDAASEGIYVNFVKDYGAALASGTGQVTFTGAEVNGARFLEVTPAYAIGGAPGLKCCAIQFELGENTDSITLEPPSAQTVAPTVARLTLEMALLPGLLQGLPATLRK